jgi:hypothetical protein
MALAALIVAAVSAAVAAASLYLVAEQLKIVREEHAHFLAELRRHAVLEVTTRIVGQDDLVFTGEGNVKAGRLGIGIDNHGTKAATHTLISVVGPRWLTDFFWSDEMGHAETDPTTGRDYTPRTTGGHLTDSAGVQHDCKFLLLTLPRVSLRSHHERFVTFKFDGNRPAGVPFRVTAESDDMAPEAEEIEHSFVVGPPSASEGPQ